MLLNSKGKSLKLAGNCVIYDGDAEKFKNAKKGRRLYLGVNDDVNGRYGNGYGDNSGEFIVEVVYE